LSYSGSCTRVATTGRFPVLGRPRFFLALARFVIISLVHFLSFYRNIKV
jgi:hypothetical protein